jgi:pimeloyl-ACP methyl ester carboxylesterase
MKIVALILSLLTGFRSHAQQLRPSDSGYVPVNGIKVYYEIYGKGEPIVLLHGSFYTIQMNWAGLIPELSKTRKVIAIELQGHGHSPYSAREMTFPGMASDVEGVMNYLKIDSADVAGYSMGGSVAYQFTIQSPKRVKRLVIISSTYKSGGWLPQVDTAFTHFKPEDFNNTPFQTAYEAVAPDKTKWSAYLNSMISFVGKPFDMGDSNVAKITAPVMIISGDNDGLDKVELAKTYELLGGGVPGDFGYMPKSRLAIVPGQTHVGLMMQTDTILGLMENFLK